jgi:hypothetical protein
MLRAMYSFFKVLRLKSGVLVMFQSGHKTQDHRHLPVPNELAHWRFERHARLVCLHFPPQGGILRSERRRQRQCGWLYSIEGTEGENEQKTGRRSVRNTIISGLACDVQILREHHETMATPLPSASPCQSSTIRTSDLLYLKHLYTTTCSHPSASAPTLNLKLLVYHHCKAQ